MLAAMGREAGADRPIHFSLGPHQCRQVVAMREGPSGRLVPRVVSLDALVRHPGPGAG